MRLSLCVGRRVRRPFRDLQWAPEFEQATRAVRVEQSRLCAKLINKYGGHAEVLMLGDDAGLKGSTHIPFADMDNEKVAALLDEFLKKAKLDGYQNSKPSGRWVWD